MKEHPAMVTDGPVPAEARRRTYGRSFWLWLRTVIWFALILFFACVAPLSKKTPIGGIFVSVLLGAMFLFFLYLFLKNEPYAIRVYADRFELRYVFGPRVYYYSYIIDVSLDTMVTRKSGEVQTVRVDFKSGRHLQLGSLAHRRRLYEDLHSSWRAASTP